MQTHKQAQQYFLPTASDIGKERSATETFNERSTHSPNGMFEK
jgi:hypothetical protein